MRNLFYCMKKITVLSIAVSLILSTLAINTLAAGAGTGTKIDSAGFSIDLSGTGQCPDNGGWAKNLLDGDYTNFWSSGHLMYKGEYLIIDMNKIYTINEVVACSSAFLSAAIPPLYYVYVSADAQTWIKVGEGVGPTAENAIFYFPETKARYIKFEVIVPNTAAYWDYHEIEVYYDPSVIVAASLPDDIEDSRYENEIKLLNSLDALVFESETAFGPENPISRSDFITMLAKLSLGDDELAVEGEYYSDVPPVHEAYSAIAAAKNLGLLSSVQGSRLRPDDNITYSEAIAMTVSLLGYSTIAESTGGYPAGYVSIAAGMNLGADVSNKDIITRGEAVKIIYNALKEKLLVQNTFVDDGTVEFEKTGETLLSRKGLVRGKGIVTANDVTMLNGKSTVPTKHVTIGETQYNRGGTAADELLGYSVEYFAEYEKDDNAVIAVFPTKNNKVIRIDAENINRNSTLSNFNYYDEEGELKRLKLHSDCYTIFNGIAKGNLKNYELIPQTGYVEAIDNDADGIYDVLKINNYINYFVSAVSNSTKSISDKYGKEKLCFENFENKNCVVYTDTNGSKGTFASIKAQTVVSVAPNAVKQENGKLVADTANTTHVTMIVSDGKVSGNIDSIETDASELAITISGDRYDVATDFISRASALEINDSSTFYIDAFGNVAACGEIVNDNSYGILRAVAYEGSVTGDLQMKIFTTAGKHAIYDVAQNVQFAGSPSSSGEIYTKANEYLKSNKTEAKIIMYHLNGAGEIDMVSLPTEVSKLTLAANRNKNTLETIPKQEMMYRQDSNSFAGFYYLGGTCFNVLLDSEGNIVDEDDAYSLKGSYNHDDVYTIKPYNINNYYVPSVLCSYEGEQGSINGWSNIMIIKSIKRALSAEGVAVCALELYNNGSVVTMQVAEDVDISKLKKNDGIMVDTNNKGVIRKINIVYDSSRDWETAISTGGGTYLTNTYMTCGKVLSFDNNFIRIDISKKTFDAEYDGSSEVYFKNVSNAVVYLQEDDKIKVGATSDISVGDYIFLRAAYTTPKEIVIVK